MAMTIGTVSSGVTRAVGFRAAGISAVFSPTYIDLDSRIKSMEETGVDAQVLSLMQPMVYWAPPAFANWRG